MRYLENDIKEENIETMSREQLDKIKIKCNPAWFKSLMLKKKVSQLDSEVKEDYLGASKKAILNYIMLDPEESERLQILVAPKMWNPLVELQFHLFQCSSCSCSDFVPNSAHVSTPTAAPAACSRWCGHQYLGTKASSKPSSSADTTYSLSTQ